jgi:hypothetical protein
MRRPRHPSFPMVVGAMTVAGLAPAGVLFGFGVFLYHSDWCGRRAADPGRDRLSDLAAAIRRQTIVLARDRGHGSRHADHQPGPWAGSRMDHRI